MVDSPSPDVPRPSDPRRSPALGPRSFTVFLGIVAAGLSIAATLGIEDGARPFTIAWPLLAAAFVLADRAEVWVEVRREAHGLTFTDLPLTVGLVFAPPETILLARLVSALARPLLRRTEVNLLKTAFTAANFVVETAVSVLAFHLVLGGSSPVDPRGWAAAIVAVALGCVVGHLDVHVVMRLAGEATSYFAHLRVLLVLLVAAGAGSAIGLAAAVTLWRDARSWVLFLAVGAGMGFFFLSYVRIRERHRALARLHDFTASLDHRDPVDLPHAVTRGLAELLGASRVVLLVPRVRSGVRSVDRFEFNDGVTSAVEHDVDDVEWAEAQAVHSSGRPASDAGSFAGVSVQPGTAITARMPLPDRPGLVLVDGRLSDVRVFDVEDVQLLETAASHASASMHNAQMVLRARAEARARATQALRDEVTGLPNQRSLTEQLVGQLETEPRVAILTIRISPLRRVNETYGMGIGDELLRQVSNRLQPLSRRSWCARSGSDEFTLVFPGGEDEARTVAESIRAVFATPVQCLGVSLAVHVGIGVALVPEHGTDIELLLRRASLAASRSDLDGTGVTTWASDRDPYDPQSLTIAADLRDAIADHDLEVYYQPQLDLATGLVNGAEALLRWRHARLGDLRPEQFIRAAENTGAIGALTGYVLEQAAVCGLEWRRRGLDFDLSVNISARNLASETFADEVAEILDRVGLPASAITLELTESSAMTEAPQAIRSLDDLHQLGVGLAIDDFGTGYSSLVHLRRLPVNEIKIDKSFVGNLLSSESDEVIVRSMVELGHNLGLQVVVEGVETVEVRDRIRQFGCDRMQGYLLARPLPRHIFDAWIVERPTRRLEEGVGQVIDLKRRSG